MIKLEYIEHDTTLFGNVKSTRIKKLKRNTVILLKIHKAML